MLVKESFYSFLLKKNITIIFITIIFIGYFGSLKAIEKISIIKFNRRKHFKKQAGHRQSFTNVEITKIAEGK